MDLTELRFKLGVTDQIKMGTPKMSAEQGQSSPRTPAGIVGLDDILNGGWPEGHLFVVEGDPGTGKTTLGLQFLMAAAARGQKSMYVTLSESQKELEGVARSHGWSLADVALFEFTPTEDSLRPEDQYSAFHPSELEFQDTTQSILEEIARVQPTHIVFDSLNEIRLLARDSLRYRRQVLALKHYFTNRGCTVLLLDDKPAEGHDMQLHSIAHGVISLERMPREYANERRRLRVAKLRGSSFREGFHDYVIETGGLKVFPRLVASEHRQLLEEGLAKSGILELDALWGGGIPLGTSTLILGPAGTGKSSLAISYAVEAANQGHFASAFIFEETWQTMMSRSAGLGMDLSALVEKDRISIQQVDPAEMSPGEFVQQVRHSVEKKNARVVVIDSLNGFLNAMPGESYLPLQMHELLTYLNQQGVITILVMAQAGIMGVTMRSPVDLSYLADNVLLLRYFEARGEVRKAVSVVKKRSGSHERTIRELTFQNKEICVGQPLTKFQGVMTGVPTFVGAPEVLTSPNHES